MKLFGTNRYCFMAANGVNFGSSERKAKCRTFYLVQLKFCHGLALMGHQILLGLPIIIHKTHSMIWRCLAPTDIVSWLQTGDHREEGKVPNFRPSSAQVLSWLGTDGSSIAVGPSHHHSLDPYQWYEAVWHQEILFHDCNWSDFWIREEGKVPNFLPSSAQVLSWPGTDGSSNTVGTPYHHS
jgi:hypothetical protein